MKIVLFRHAERQTSDPLGLSAYGYKQAERIVDLVHTKILPHPGLLLVSPKPRARLTLTPLAKSLKLELTPTEDLDERAHQENAKFFSQRVQRFLKKCEKMQGSIFLVTHLDWIEEALIRIPANVDLISSNYQHWSPGDYMLFHVDKEVWNLEEFGETKC